MKEPIKRLDALKTIAAAVPAVALTAAPALAADNKKQFKYQDKPGKNGQKCAGCSLFKAPNACSVVQGKISPNGWCIAYAPKAKH